MVMDKKDKCLVKEVISAGDKRPNQFVFKEFEDFIWFGQRSVEKK